MLENSPLTKSGDGAINDEEGSPEQEDSEKQEEQDGEKDEQEFATNQSAPNTPRSVNAPSAQLNEQSTPGSADPPSSQHNQQQQLTPLPLNVPIQPFYAPYMYPQYPGMPLVFPGQAMMGANSGNYVDASGMPDPPPDTRPRNRGGVAEPFPMKLHKMLEACEQDGLGDVVSFFSHGRAFAIHKPRKFQDTVMKKFFRQTRLTSFQRQLNLYGFHRINQGPDHGGYYHEFFLRGRPRLCLNMKRTKIKGDQRHSNRDYEGEPNFYAMPPVMRPAAPAPAAEANATTGPPQPSPPPASSMPSPGQQAMLQPFPFGFAPPGAVFAPQPVPGPYTAAQSSPSPAPGVQQQQQQQQQQQMMPFPQQFYGGYPPWAGMPPQVAFGTSPARASGPPTPAASTTGEDASPSKS